MRAQGAQQPPNVGMLMQKGASAQMGEFSHAHFIYVTTCVLRKVFQ